MVKNCFYNELPYISLTANITIPVPNEIMFGLQHIVENLNSTYSGCYYKDNIVPFILFGSELTNNLVVNSYTDIIDFLDDGKTGITVFDKNPKNGNIIEFKLYKHNLSDFYNTLNDNRTINSVLLAMLEYAESEFMLTSCEEADIVRVDKMKISSNYMLARNIYDEFDTIVMYLATITKTAISVDLEYRIIEVYNQVFKLINKFYTDKRNSISLNVSGSTIVASIYPSPSSIRYLLNLDILNNKK